MVLIPPARPTLSATSSPGRPPGGSSVAHGPQASSVPLGPHPASNSTCSCDSQGHLSALPAAPAGPPTRLPAVRGLPPFSGGSPTWEPFPSQRHLGSRPPHHSIQQAGSFCSAGSPAVSVVSRSQTPDRGRHRVLPPPRHLYRYTGQKPESPLPPVFHCAVGLLAMPQLVPGLWSHLPPPQAAPRPRSLQGP